MAYRKPFEFTFDPETMGSGPPVYEDAASLPEAMIGAEMRGEEAIDYKPETKTGRVYSRLARGLGEESDEEDGAHPKGLPVTCLTCMDNFSQERGIIPFQLPCSHWHCGRCLEKIMASEPSEKEHAGKIHVECMQCKAHTLWGSLDDIPSNKELAATAEKSRMMYENEDIGQPVGRTWNVPLRPRPLNMKPLTDCGYHLQGKCLRQSGACPYRHPMKAAGRWPGFCEDWANGESCFDLVCPLLHPPKGLCKRTDCHRSTPGQTCRGWIDPKRCPFRHKHRQDKWPMDCGICPKWERNFKCPLRSCPLWHPADIYVEGGIKEKEVALEYAGLAVGVFWDLETCPVPKGQWAYSVATCVDRYLRVMGLLKTGEGWRLTFHAAIPKMNSAKVRRELTEARVKLSVVGVEPGAVQTQLKTDYEKFVAVNGNDRTSALVIVSGSEHEDIRRIATLGSKKGYNVLLVAPLEVVEERPVSMSRLFKAVKHVERWEDVSAVAVPSPGMILAEEEAKGDSLASLLASGSGAGAGAGTGTGTGMSGAGSGRGTTVSTSDRTVSTMDTARAEAVAAAGRVKATPCPYFLPALQSGCKLEDACPYFHQKRICPRMLDSNGSCPDAHKCLFRHVPISGPGTRGPYLAAVAKRDPDKFGLIPPRFKSGHGVFYYKHAIRKVYSLSRVEERAAFQDDLYEPPPPGFWTCCNCGYRFNAPPDPEAGVSREDCVCDLCESHYDQTGPIAATTARLPGCWVCDGCRFYGNTPGLDERCQLCDVKAPDPNDDGVGSWFCLHEAEFTSKCMYETRDDIDTCDFCFGRKDTNPLALES